MRRNDFQYVCSNGFPKEPVVSVLVLAYNHEKFIAQALDSIVCQLTDFPYEIVVGEDCSSDTTKEICMDYQRRYPDKVKLLLQKKNKGLIGNFCDTLRTCKGKYIAECAGDDFWNDCHKLQKHVDYMNRHEDVVVTYHDASTINGDTQIVDYGYLSENRKKNFSSEELQRGVWIIPQTMCFRSVVTHELIENINNNVYNEDIFQISLFGLYGRGVFLDNIDNSLYRMTEQSIWSLKSIIHKSLMASGTLGELCLYYKRKNILCLFEYYREKLISKISVIQDGPLDFSERKFACKILIRYWKEIGIKNILHYLKYML